MTEARQRSWLAVAGLLAMLGAPGCGCSDERDDNPRQPGTGGTSASGGSAGRGGSSGSGGLGHGRHAAGRHPTAAARSASRRRWRRRTPSTRHPIPTGKTVYYTALDPTLGPGVFKVPVGGGTPTTLHAGAPFAAPFGIATSTNGSSLYVADPASEWADGRRRSRRRRADLRAEPERAARPQRLTGTTGSTRPAGSRCTRKTVLTRSTSAAATRAALPGVFKVASGGGNAPRSPAERRSSIRAASR